MSDSQHGSYYLPAPSHWPIIGSIGLFCFMLGAANWIHGNAIGPWLFLIGTATVVFMLYGWFGAVIAENRAGLLSDRQVERSFRWGMVWFIFTEVMFFAAFFGVLFYTRYLSVPWLGGAGSGQMTHTLLWPNFQAQWPLLQTPNPTLFVGPKSVIEAWGLPAINTFILLTSGAAITIAHWGLLHNNRRQMIVFQTLTILLGLLFLSIQAHEYSLAYTVKGLKLSAGIYGATFFMLTGFHAMHVTVGVIMLSTILWRMTRGDFTRDDHFGFEAVAWYWHFVDVVWLMLFLFVYWM